MSLHHILRGRHQRKNKVVRRDHFARKLRLETLEDRRMLATMVVTELGDGSLASLTGDGQLSLREAVEAINTGAPVDGIGPVVGNFGTNDTILFTSVLFIGSSPTLTLTAGQFELANSVTLAAPTGRMLTLDAQQNSRIFDITSISDDFVLSRLNLIGGLTTGLDEQGGAIRSITTGNLHLSNAVLEGNATTGNFSRGGTISAVGMLTVVDSSITNSRTEGTSGNGGGIFSLGDVSLTRSTLADNSTAGLFANGGGVSSEGHVTIVSSTVSGNRTLGAASSAGGVLGVGGVDLTESTVSGNQTAGDTSSGGGVSSAGTITVTRSTIVNNKALGANASGGGVQTSATDIVVSGSIIANNTAGGGNADIQPGKGTLTVDHSLVGDATGLGIAAATNLLNLDPKLGPLLANGGSTNTHAPLVGSSVIDAGDPLFVAPPLFDQRGASFSRIADGDGNGSAVIDIGSYEVPTPVVIESADFDGDDDVDGSDFLAWQRGFGKTTGAVPEDGDSDQDGDVDEQDLLTWQSQFGSEDPLLGLSAPPQAAAAAVADRLSLIDLAFAIEFGETEQSDSDLASLLQPANVAEGSSQAQDFATILPVTPAAAIEVDVLATAKASQDSTVGDLAFDEELVVAAL